jgi:hypothetical protein
VFAGERTRGRIAMKSASVDWSRVYGLSKLIMLFRCYGPGTALGVVGSVVEDLYLRVFDRRYSVRSLLSEILMDSSWGQAFYVFKLRENGNDAE